MENSPTMNQTIKRKSGNFYSKLVGFFLLLTIAAIGIVLHFALAKVEIKLETSLDNKEASVLVEMKPEDSQEVSEDSILGKIINTELELSASVTSSQELTNSDRAGGYVTIYNNYSKSQPLVKTTRLITPDNKLFRITEGITVPAGEKVEVWAEADAAGEEFVTEATTFKIPGLWEGLQDKIYGETLSGMQLQSVPVFKVSQENLDAAQEKIRLEAIAKSLAAVNELVGDGLTIDEKHLKLSFETLSGSQLGETSKDTTLTQKVTAHGLVFAEESLLKVAKEKFSKELEDQQVVINFEENPITYEILEINLENNTAILEVKTNISVRSGENKWDIDKDTLVGLDEAGIKEYFAQFNPEKIEIKFSPFWVKKVPRLKDHIIIE